MQHIDATTSSLCVLKLFTITLPQRRGCVEGDQQRPGVCRRVCEGVPQLCASLAAQEHPQGLSVCLSVTLLTWSAGVRRCVPVLRVLHVRHRVCTPGGPHQQYHLRTTSM